MQINPADLGFHFVPPVPPEVNETAAGEVIKSSNQETSHSTFSEFTLTN